MLILKTFRYRLRLTKKQAKILQMILDECRWLYNYLLEQRILSHEELNIFLTKIQQNMFLPLLKEERPSLHLVHSQVLQNVVDRLDKSFQAFFRRCKVEIERKRSSLKECIVVADVDIRQPGITTRHKIFWPSDWMALE